MARDRLADLQQGYNNAPAPNASAYHTGGSYPANIPGSANGGRGRPYQAGHQAYEMQPAASGSGYSRSPSSGRTAGGSSAGGGRPVGTPDDFARQIDAVQEIIQSMESNVSRLRQLHQRSLVEVSTTQQATLKRQVDALTDATTSMAQEGRNALKKLKPQIRSLPAEARIRQTQHAAATQRLLTATQEFSRVQSEARGRMQNQMQRQYRIARPDATPAEVEAAVAGGAGNVFQQEMMGSVGAQRRALQEVQGRREELHKIEQSMEELFSLFQDMEALLDTQQNQINDIDAHVEDTVVQVQSGGQEMTRAIKHAKNARRLKWILFFVCLAIALVIALVIYFNRCNIFGASASGCGGNNNPSNNNASNNNAPSNTNPGAGSTTS